MDLIFSTFVSRGQRRRNQVITPRLQSSRRGVTARAERQAGLQIVSCETKSLSVLVWQSVRRCTKGQSPANQSLRRQPPSSQAITSRSAFTASPPRNAGSHLGVKCRIFLLRCSNKSCFGVTQKAAIDKTTIAGRFLSGELVYADFSLTDANWDEQLQRMETELFPVLQGSTPGCSGNGLFRRVCNPAYFSLVYSVFMPSF